MIQHATLHPPIRMPRATEEDVRPRREREDAGGRSRPMTARERQAAAGGRRAPWPMALATLAVFGLFGYVVWYAYLQDSDGLGGEPPLVRAQAGPYKHVPDDRGGLQVSNQAASVIDVFRPAPKVPPAEVLSQPADARPDPRAGELRIATAPDAPDASLMPPPPAPVAATPDPAVVTTSATISAVPLPSSPAADPTTSAEPLAALEARDIDPATAASPRGADAARAVTATAARPVPPVKVTSPANPAAPAVWARSGSVASLEPAPSSIAPPSRAAAAAAAGGYRLQLVALKSDSVVNQAWSQLQRRHPGVLGGLAPSVERVATTGGTMYRLQAGPFASRSAATEACVAMQAQGGQCFVVQAGQ